MSEQNTHEHDETSSSPLLSRSTIAILVAILLIHSGAIVGIFVGRVSDDPITIMCLLSAVAGIICFFVVSRQSHEVVDDIADQES